MGSEIIGEPFGEYRVDELREVYVWYREQLLSKILDVPYWNDWKELDAWKHQLKEALLYKGKDVETKEKLAGIFVLDIYESIIWSNSVREIKGGAVVIHKCYLE